MITFTGKEPLADMPWDKYYFIIRFKQASKHIRWTTQFQNWNVFAAQKTAIEQLGELYESIIGGGTFQRNDFSNSSNDAGRCGLRRLYYQHDTKSGAKCGICRQCDSSQICQYVLQLWTTPICVNVPQM